MLIFSHYFVLDILSTYTLDLDPIQHQPPRPFLNPETWPCKTSFCLAVSSLRRELLFYWQAQHQLTNERGRMVSIRRRCPLADVQCLGPRTNVDFQICLSIFSCSCLFHCCCCCCCCCCCIYQFVSLHVITDAGQCHWWDQTLVRKIGGLRRRSRVAVVPGGKVQPTGTRLSPNKPTLSSSSYSPSPWIQGPSAPGKFRSHHLFLL